MSDTTIMQIHHTSDMQLVPQNELQIRLEEYLEDAESENTKRAHKSDWRLFETWCQAYGWVALPAAPETVGFYISFLDMCGKKRSTISRHLATISGAHKAAGLESPTQSFLVQKAWDGFLRKSKSPQKSKDAIRTKQLRLMLSTLPNNLRGERDRALLLLGFAGAFRRSELVSISMEDIEETEEGLTIALRHSKTDQHGEGQEVSIPYGSHLESCPVRAVKRWIEKSGLTTGYLFRAVHKGVVEPENKPLSDRNVWYIVRRQAKKAGLKDPERFGAHSLRSGLATSAAEGGASESSIMEQTRHKSVQMVRRYIKKGTRFKDNAASFTGL